MQLAWRQKWYNQTKKQKYRQKKVFLGKQREKAIATRANQNTINKKKSSKNSLWLRWTVFGVALEKVHNRCIISGRDSWAKMTPCRRQSQNGWYCWSPKVKIPFSYNQWQKEYGRKKQTSIYPLSKFFFSIIFLNLSRLFSTSQRKRKT